MNDQVNPTAPVLIDGANDITAFASTDENRYVLNGVYMNGKGTEATNGRIAIRVPFVMMGAEEFPPVKGATAEREPVIIPTKAFKEAISNAGKVKSTLPVLNCVRVSTFREQRTVIDPKTKAETVETETKAQLATTDLDASRVIETRVVDGNYPNIAQVYPNDEPKLTISLSAVYVKMIAEYALKHGKSDQAPITFRFTDELSGVRFDIPLEDGRKAEGVLMPMRLS